MSSSLRYTIWCPHRYKWQLVDALMVMFPEENKGHWMRMAKRQLYAIWYAKKERV